MSKLKRFVSVGDRKKLDEIIRRELYHYSEIKHDCENVIDTLWQLINVINDKKEITVSYFKVDRTLSEKRIQPVSLMFKDMKNEKTKTKTRIENLKARICQSDFNWFYADENNGGALWANISIWAHITNRGKIRERLLLCGIHEYLLSRAIPTKKSTLRNFFIAYGQTTGHSTVSPLLFY
jgi:hypothetical protein